MVPSTRDFPRSLLLAVALVESVNSAALSTSIKARYLEHVSQLKPSYEYVIVGGGTSGLTVADRLTEDGKSTSSDFPT